MLSADDIELLRRTQGSGKRTYEVLEGIRNIFQRTAIMGRYSTRRKLLEHNELLKNFSPRLDLQGSPRAVSNRILVALNGKYLVGNVHGLDLLIEALLLMESEDTGDFGVTVLELMSEGSRHYCTDLAIVCEHNREVSDWLGQNSGNENLGNLLWLLNTSPLVFDYCGNMELLAWADVRVTIDKVVATKDDRCNLAKALLAVLIRNAVNDLDD